MITMDDDALIAERLLAWDSETEPLAPLSDVQFESIASLAELSKERPFPFDVRNIYVLFCQRNIIFCWLLFVM